MELRRLILAPALPVRMRYQEWWPSEFVAHLSDVFSEVVVLGDGMLVDVERSEFSGLKAAISWEMRQIDQYLELDPGPSDVLLHLDLSFPGLFHQVLYHRRPGRAFVFCHATARNRYDVFARVRKSKWASESAVARLYDNVLVSTKYHAAKLGWKNVIVMGGLPNPPAEILPPVVEGVERDIVLCSVARGTRQKVNRRLEFLVSEVVGERVHRVRFDSWGEYYRFLDRCRFLLVTSSEETYGYQVVDAVLRGCVPIAPRAFSFPELLPDGLLYPWDGLLWDRAFEIRRILRSWQGRPWLLNESSIHGFFERLKEVLLG